MHILVEQYVLLTHSNYDRILFFSTLYLSTIYIRHNNLYVVFAVFLFLPQHQLRKRYFDVILLCC